MLLYFAYGSNLHKEQMKRRCSDSISVSRATLPDYELVFRGVADVVPAGGEKVVGALYKISVKDLVVLDRYEGFPNLYIKEIVTVETEVGPVEAFIYVMNPHKNRWVMSPNYYYARSIEEGYQHWGLDLDKLYQAILKSKIEEAI